MKRHHVKQGKAKRLPSVEENLSGQASDEDTPHVTIDIDKAREEFRRLAEVQDEPPEEPGSTAAADRYILSFFIRRGSDEHHDAG
jgi:hypothetical protein